MPNFKAICKQNYYSDQDYTAVTLAHETEYADALWKIVKRKAPACQEI